MLNGKKRVSLRPWLMGTTMLLLALVLLAPGRVRPVAGQSDSAGQTTDQIIVRLAPGADLAAVNATYGTVTVRPFLDSTEIYLLAAPAGSDTAQLATTMSDDPQIQYAEPNAPSHSPEAQGVDSFAWPSGDAQSQGVDSFAWPGSNAQSQGVDSFAWPGNTVLVQGVDSFAWPDTQSTITITTATLTTTSSLANTDTFTPTTISIGPRVLYGWESDVGNSNRFRQQPAHQTLNLPQAHAINQGNGIVIAVLDTGVDMDHAMLAPVLTGTGYDFIDDDADPDDEANGLDDDGDGFIDEVTGHGTHVAGIAHLVAPQAQIMPLRVLDSDGQGDSFVIAEAMLYAAQNGADVINLSLSTETPSALMTEVLEQVTAQDVVVVAAAGNLATDTPQYPAAATCALGVTALKQTTKKEPYAGFGDWVDVAAPGNRIYSTYTDGIYAWWSGTSMATPFVAGQAALLRAHTPTLSLADLGHLIGGTAAPVDTANQEYAGLLGAGRVDVGASLDTLASGTPLQNAPALLTPCGPTATEQ